MSNKQKETTPERKLLLSESDTDRNEKPEINNVFYRREIPLSQLESRLKAKNYAAIIWRQGTKANGANFEFAESIIVDIDNGEITIGQAIATLQNLKINYALITSKRHGQPHDRFHLIVPLSRRIVSLDEYTRVQKAFLSTHFSMADQGVTDGARGYCGSPDNAIFMMDFSHSDYDVDADAAQEKEQLVINMKAIGESKRIEGSWNDGLLVKVATTKQLDIAVNLKPGTKIYCPFHMDNRASAVLGYSENSHNFFIYCSACAKTYWHMVDGNVMDRRLDDFWSHGESVYQSGFTGSEFSFQKVGKEKFFVMTGARKEEDKARMYEHLVRHKHLHSLGIVEYRGSMKATELEYAADPTRGITTVDIPAIEVRGEDNAVIENYLETTFGQYKPFIKQWLAAYCYSNHQKLPTLILTGARGTGKNTFAEWVAVIFEQLSVTVQDISGAFNPFAEKKLGILDEALKQGRLQYAELKKLSGQEWFEINKKYMPQYKVRNNLNLIILSNDLLPITVASSELPTDPGNNQFFVYEMPAIPGGSIDPDFKFKLRRNLRHYIDAELKTVYDHVRSNMAGCRYTIPTPITEWEERLFKFSRNEVELITEQLVEQIEDTYAQGFNSTTQEFLHAGYLLSEMVNEHVNGKTRLLNNVRLQLVQKGVIKEGMIVRHVVQGTKRSCYELTDEFYQRLASANPTYLPPAMSKVDVKPDPAQNDLEFADEG